MEFGEIVVKETPGLCRCCLSEGCYKDLSTEYTWMDEQEIYADMLLECFDISISQHMEGPNGLNRLICEVCITRLRDACNFKKQVFESEKKFVDMVGRGEFRVRGPVYAEPKEEISLELQPIEEAEVEYLDDDMDYDDGNRDEPEPTVSEDITVSALPVKGKRGRPKKALVKPEKKKSKVDDKPKTRIAKGETLNRQPKRTMPSKKKIASLNKKKELEDKTTRTLDAMRQNIIEVLQKSTIMPFRWLSSCFRCFYCYEMFDKPQDLKSHQQTHGAQDLEKNMKNYCEPLVHVDVSEISCKLCYARMDDVFQLVDHLIILHEIPFDREIGISFVPMKLDEGPKCFFCAMVMKTYALLLTHMNKFHKNYFKSTCVKCGRQFKGYEDFCHHAKNQILDDYQEKCSICGLLLSYGILRTHMKDVHGRRYKCLSCFEFFTTHYKRSNHMADVHNRRDRVKCSYCNKTFIFKSIMQRHVRENHLKVKNAVCEVCGWKTFGKHELVNHMARHTNVRLIKCPACDKFFKTSRYMKKHYAKNHEQ